MPSLRRGLVRGSPTPEHRLGWRTRNTHTGSIRFELIEGLCLLAAGVLNPTLRSDRIANMSGDLALSMLVHFYGKSVTEGTTEFHPNPDIGSPTHAQKPKQTRTQTCA
jgi:hypothetical protein